MICIRKKRLRNSFSATTASGEVVDRDGISEEQLTIFDLLTKPASKVGGQEEG